MVRVTWATAPLLKPISLARIPVGPGTATQLLAQVSCPWQYIKVCDCVDQITHGPRNTQMHHSTQNRWCHDCYTWLQTRTSKQWAFMLHVYYRKTTLCEDCGYVTYANAGDGTRRKQTHTVSPTILYWLCPTPLKNVRSHLLLYISIHSSPSVLKYQEINTVQFFPFKSIGTPVS